LVLEWPEAIKALLKDEVFEVLFVCGALPRTRQTFYTLFDHILLSLDKNLPPKRPMNRPGERLGKTKSDIDLVLGLA